MDVIPTDVDEPRQSLWALTMGPAIWAVHFLASYAAAAVWCGNAGAHARFGAANLVFAAATALALAAVAWVAWDGWRRYNHGAAVPSHHPVPSHHKDTPEDRHRFLGLATLLLAVLSAVSILYTAMAVVMLRGCS
jgi:hypothetical protein